MCAVLLLTVFGFLLYGRMDGTVSDFIIEKSGNNLYMRWNNSSSPSEKEIVIEKDGLQEKIVISEGENEYCYHGCTPGDFYHISICSVGPLRIKYGTIEKDFFCINHEDLTGLPYVCIETVDRKDPDRSVVYPKGTDFGVSITDNDYKEGVITVYSDYATTFHSPVKIKVRGNTSAINEKVPYKLLFDNEYNLLGDEGETKSSGWLLLKNEDLKTCMGYYLAAFIQNKACPAFEFINLEINGDYKGSYLLVRDPVEMQYRELTEAGVLFENDPYYWNENDSFKTNGQHQAFEWTIKYPKNADEVLKAQAILKQRIGRAEVCLDNDETGFFDVFDGESFVRWIIVHDLLATTDAAGSNMYLCSENLYDENERIVMGIAQDFDSSFEAADTWSSIHTSDYYYYAKLFQKDNFKKQYQDIWRELSEKIVPCAEDFMISEISEKTEAIQRSWEGDAGRWEHPANDCTELGNTMISFLRNQTDWIDANTSVAAFNDQTIVENEAPGAVGIFEKMYKYRSIAVVLFIFISMYMIMIIKGVKK